MLKKGTLTIEVQDSGIGIDSSQISKLFKPFSSASEEHHKMYGGTGLGLWISKVIVELMDGKISCRSKPGKGTQFSFTFPVDYYASEQSETLPHNLESKGAGQVGGGSGINLAGRIKKLTDMAQVLEGQKIIFILLNSVDILLLRERLKCIKNVDIQEFKNIDQVDIQAEITLNKRGHLIFFIDDPSQLKNEILQDFHT